MISTADGAPQTSWSRRDLAIIAGLLTAFVALCIIRALDHSYPFYDDVSYLDFGYQIQRDGGTLGLLHGLISGTYLEDNRSPLYLWLLSFVAGRDFAYHHRAQAVGIAIGVVMIISWCWVTRRHLGRLPALWVTAFLCLSETAIAYASKESCEPLLMVFWAFGVSAVLDGAPTAEGKRSNGWLWAGAFAGLAFLTKGNGAFLLFILGVAALFHSGWRALRDWRLWGSGLTFTLVALPLLIRNVRVYGSPLRSWNSQLLWMDRLGDFGELNAPHAFDRMSHTPMAYLSHLTAWAAIQRAGEGLGETLAHIGDAMSLVAPRPWGPAHITLLAIGLGCAVWAVVLVWRSPRSFSRTFMLTMIVWFYAFFAFYNVVSGSSRFVFPMTVPLVAVLGAKLTALGWSNAVTRRAVVLMIVAPCAAVLVDTSPRSPPAGFLEAEQWVTAHLRPGESVAVDSRSKLQPIWLLPPQTQQVTIATTWHNEPVPESEMLAWMHEKHVRYVVVDGSSNLYGDARWFFYSTLKRAPDGSLPAGPLPPGLRLAYAGAEQPRRWEILELE